MPDEPSEYCYKENEFFPTEQFYDDPRWGRVHRTERPHTVTGDHLPRGQGQDPGVLMTDGLNDETSSGEEEDAHFFMDLPAGPEPTGNPD